MKTFTNRLLLLMISLFAFGSVSNAQNECLTPKEYTAVIDANGIASIQPEDVVTIGTDCNISSLIVEPNVFSCDHLGTQTVTVTGTSPGQPTGNYASVPIQVWDAYSDCDIVSGDFDGDGDQDIVSNRGWHKNFQPNYFQRIDLNSSDLRAPQLGDLDGDGDLDLISGNGVYLWNQAASAFQFKQHFNNVSMSVWHTSNLADFDNDGDLDWYVTTYYHGENGKERLFINDGTGNFTLGNSYVVGAYQITTASGDFNEDGLMDVVIAGYYDVYVGLNDGAFASGNPVNFNFASVFTNGNDYIRTIHANDLNGDGHLDLVFAGYARVGGAMGLIMMPGNGDGSFQAAQIIDIYGSLTWDMDVNDFEGDGDLDLVTVVNGQQSKLYINDGNGNFTANALPFTGGYWNVMKIRMDDFNNDGICDFAKSNQVLITAWSEGEAITLNVDITVSDPNSICNAPPVAAAQNVSASTDDNCQAFVSIADVDNGSFDPDGDVLTYSIFPEGPYALGATEVTLTVSDGQYTSSATAVITVTDDTAPVATVSSTPMILWPPNHKYSTVYLSDFVLSATDNCSEISVENVVITSVSSDEAEDANGNGDGNTLNDIVIAADCKSVELRRERQGNGNGRVYTIFIETTDNSGNSSASSFQVFVPKNNNGSAIDGGAAYTVTGNCGSGNKSTVVSDAFAENADMMKIYPNPSSGMAQLEVKTSLDAYTRIEMYNAFGTRVKLLYEGNMASQNTHSIQIDARGYANGMYYIKMQSGKDKTEVVKFVLSR